MPRRLNLSLGKRQPLSRQTAWGCFTSNVALPGSGSLLAGRLSGYYQLALAFLGLILTLALGLRFVWWYFANKASLSDPQIDPATKLAEMWPVMFWPLLGIAIFGFGWLWGVLTGLQILREAKDSEPQNVPPKLS
ncbi:MAG: hypothetical protein C5B50_04435 [Verrucomicrobia bacterium]|nr:MAG: hypothetical protein C5B50_04435 [Verrucomicrobiota bacterium]